MSNPQTTSGLGEPRRFGAWVIFPLDVIGGIGGAMIYHKEGNDLREAMPIKEWNKLPIYSVRSEYAATR